MNFGRFIHESMGKTMQSKQLVRCPICEAVNHNTPDIQVCRRCGTKIQASLSSSFHKTLAYLITAMILYIPANAYPILLSKQLGIHTESTIIGGIILLWEGGSYPIAIIILIASIMVPILKFLLLIYLLIASKYPTYSTFVDKHKLFYLTETIGSWSMVDVFVVMILSVLIHFSGVQIYPGTGASAFALMVFFTMLSALSFDTRLIVNHQHKK